MTLFTQLNLQQQKAVTSNSDVLCIIAGAGSGKTRVLTLRIAYLIKEMNIMPRNILAITFTNKAANEMKKRLANILSSEQNKCFISTIHALCVRILGQDINFLNYKNNFIICDANDQKQILKEIYHDLNISKDDLPYNKCLNYISKQKNENISPEEALKEAYYEEIKKKAQVYNLYTKHLLKNNALDFDDLILKTLQLFKENPAIARKWATYFNYVLVDEFQDIDKQQYALIKYLTARNKRLFVVGDPDQTIYTWRGAQVDIIMNFKHDFPQAETIILNQNYRSSTMILNAANSLIEHNSKRLKKELFSKNILGEAPIYKTLDSERNESYFVIEKIASFLKQGVPLNQIAILYRANYLSRTIESCLRENGLPYTIYGGLRFYDRAEIKDMLCYLRLIVSGDDFAFLRIINTPRRSIGTATINKIKAAAKTYNLSLYDTIKKHSFGKSEKQLKNFVSMVENWRNLADELPIEDLITNIANESGYLEMLKNNKETDRIDNIYSLQDEIKEFTTNNPDADLNTYLQQISLYSDLDNREINDNKQIVLSTIHAAKGLEFEVVFVIGLAENIFPSDKTLEEGINGLEEERRLAYVAFTRAKKALILTNNTEYSYVIKSHKTASRFIEEIDHQYLNNLNNKEKINSSSTYNKVLPSKPLSSSAIKSFKLKKGDIVYHAIFQKGIVTKIENNTATIAFSLPYGIKKIMANHPSLSKKEK